MIISMLINLIVSIISGLFSVLPSIPSLPPEAINAIDSFVDVIFGSYNLFSFFIRPSTVAIVVPIALGITFFEEIYSGIMFVIKKIPFINVN